jgi:hypothetical protein
MSYQVVFNYTSEITGKTEKVNGEYKTEREAVRQIDHVKRVSNLELVSYSPNIRPESFGH